MTREETQDHVPEEPWKEWGPEGEKTWYRPHSRYCQQPESWAMEGRPTWVASVSEMQTR